MPRLIHFTSLTRARVCAVLQIFFLCLIATVTSADEKKRVALVIGNSEYDHVSRLVNPENDAQDISRSLKRIGFDVTTGVNLDYNGMRIALRDFAEKAADADVTIVYYAGHGIEIENTNYLIPVSATLQSDRDVEFEAIRLDSIVNAIADTPGLKIVLVDACRNNPFVAQMTRVSSTRSIGRGLAAIEPGGVLVGYAARGGTLAQDGTGRNSPYAKALLEYIEEPGLELGKMFRRIRDRVFELTDGFQEPFTYGSLPGEDIYFVPTPEPTLVALPVPDAQRAAAPAPARPVTRANVLAAAISVNSVRGYALHAQAYGTDDLLTPDVLEELGSMGPKWTKPEARQSQMENFLLSDRAARAALQASLNEAGFDVGTPDGAFGPKTRAGIAALQRERGLEATGHVGLGTLTALGALEEVAGSDGFISNPYAARHDIEALQMLGETEEIIEVLSCLGLRKSVYGTFQGSFYIAVVRSGHVLLARTEAEKCGVDLASITSAAENAFVVRMFSTDPAFWNVGYDSKTKVSYKLGPYFGLRKDPKEDSARIGWRWYSGEPVDYTNWLPGKPNRNHGKGAKAFAQFQYERTGRRDLDGVPATQWFDGSGSYAQSVILEGRLR